MARFGKYTKLIYILFALVLIEFIGLAGVLAADNSKASEAPAAPAETDAGGESSAPEWLVSEPEQLTEARVDEAPPEDALTGWEILSSTPVIAHGLGEVDGVEVLNCLEGFQQQYERGVRAFEVDMRLTSDQQVVLRHDWRAGWQSGISETSIPTLKEFLARPILKKYTPMSFRDLLLLMEQYPDICVVTDTKFTDAEIVTLQFEAMLRDAEELGLSYLFDRMIVQVYDPLMFEVVDSVHHFSNYVYTLYSEGFSRTESAFREKAEFCREKGIQGITMWDYWWRDVFAPIAEEYGVTVYTHTVNDPLEAVDLIERGVSGVYTDSLAPEDLESPETVEGDGGPDGAADEDIPEGGE